jgi:preprotein translocase subunit SecA
LMSFLKISDDEPIENRMVSNSIDSAQSKIEGMNFDARKHVLEYDDVMNKHREVIYKKRKEMLTITAWQPVITDWLKTPEEKKGFEDKVKELGENFDQVAKFVSLRTLDMLWMNHLEEMEMLRDAVRLRAYGQQDPLVEYKTEGHKTFQKLLEVLESSIIDTLLKASLKAQPAPPQKTGEVKPLQTVNRNDPCPCGSGKKYKKCHGNGN